ncbi:HIT domain-containing protein [Candidatus Woesebacteria bacterium]|nr:HIT domain-containing protein [Candidatus Woesebacteria bacterium]
MIRHAPKNYKCPICIGLSGVERKDTLLKLTDEVYKDDVVTAYINSFWIPTCEGHVIIVPNKHYENIYELPNNVGQRIFLVAKKISIAMKNAYKCDGITIRQNNEPASQQHAFHYHLHVFPRYEGDKFESLQPKDKILSNPKDRMKFANKLKQYL